MARRPPNAAVSARLRTRLDRLGWDQKTLAERAGVAAAGVSVVHAGTKLPTLDYLVKVVPAMWPEENEAVLRELMLECGYPVPGLYLRALDGSEAGDPLERVVADLWRGPWPSRVIEGVTAILEPWVVNSSGQRDGVARQADR